MNPPASTGPAACSRSGTSPRRTLRQKDKAAHDKLIAKVFRGFTDYDNDPEKLETVFEELLRLLS